MEMLGAKWSHKETPTIFKLFLTQYNTIEHEGTHAQLKKIWSTTTSRGMVANDQHILFHLCLCDKYIHLAYVQTIYLIICLELFVGI